MDSVCLGLNAKDSNFGEGENAKKDDDRLSNLPCIIIADILTLLPTKDAVRTTVLSTKWKYLWSSVTKLHIDDQLLLHSGPWRCRRAEFMNFVDRVVLLLGNQMIHKFHLSCSEKYDQSRVHLWISNVMQRNVQKLSIVFDSCDPVGSQSSFYRLHDNDSLTELDLEVSWRFEVPTSICFSNLRILTLSTVKFLNKGLPHSNELHFSFLHLEVLNLLDCAWEEAEVVHIDAPMLNTFRVYEPVELENCVVKIHGSSSLTKFRCDGWGYGKFILTSPSSVIDATISIDELAIYPGFRGHETGTYTCTLLRQFSSLKYLTLPFETLVALFRVEDLEEQFPSINELIHLTVRSQIHILDETLIFILRRMPFLEALIFTDFQPPPSCFVKAAEEVNFKRELGAPVSVEVVPSCLQFHLKLIKLENFHGEKYLEGGLELAKFLLKNALVLEEMTITAEGISPSEFKALKEELLEAPRGSEHALLYFSS